MTKETRVTKPEKPWDRGVSQFGFEVSGFFGFRHSSFGFSNGVVADKQCTCPASKLMWERYPPAPPAFACCTVAGAGWRVEAQGAKTDFVDSESGLRLGKSISIAGNSTKGQREAS